MNSEDYKKVILSNYVDDFLDLHSIVANFSLDELMSIDYNNMAKNLNNYESLRTANKIIISNNVKLEMSGSPTIREVMHWCIVAKLACHISNVEIGSEESNNIIDVALLHDIIEDGYLEYENILPEHIANDVLSLTDVTTINNNIESRNRIESKLMSIDSLRNCSSYVKKVKYSDRIHNLLRTIFLYSLQDVSKRHLNLANKFARGYLLEDQLFRMIFDIPNNNLFGDDITIKLDNMDIKGNYVTFIGLLANYYKGD